MILGEYGNVLRVDTGVDISTATNLAIFISFEGVETELPGTLGTVEITSPCGDVFAANTYMYYTIQNLDITAAGKWRCWCEFDLDGVHRIGEAGFFTVEPRG